MKKITLIAEIGENHLGKIELAKKWITQAYIMEPSEPEIIDHLSQIYLQLNRTKESRYLDNKIILFHKDYFKYNEVLDRN